MNESNYYLVVNELMKVTKVPLVGETLSQKDLLQKRLDKEVNGASRGNLDFNFAERSTRTTDDCIDCKRSATYWEPGNDKKGQLARISFYMDLRYKIGSEFDLSLETSPGRSGSFSLGNRKSLLWHCSNKVTEEERTRNNKVHKWQGKP